MQELEEEKRSDTAEAGKAETGQAQAGQASAGVEERRESPARQSRSRSRSRSHSASRSASYSPSASHSPPRRSLSRSPRRLSRDRSVTRSRSPYERRPRARRGTERRQEDDMQSVEVSGLTKMVQGPHLEHIFGQYGSIREVVLPTFQRSGESRGKGWIVFRSSESALKAEECMDGGQVDGAVVSVKQAHYAPNRAESGDQPSAVDYPRRPYPQRGNPNGHSGWGSRGRAYAGRVEGGRDSYGSRNSYPPRRHDSQSPRDRRYAASPSRR